MKKLMLDRFTIRAIAEEVVNVMEERKPQKLVGTKEAARILGISERRLRKIKNELGYVKHGEMMQGRLMFDADKIRNSFTNLIMRPAEGNNP